MIRRRLLVAITLAVALAIGSASWLVVRSLEDALIDDVDDELRSGDIAVDRPPPGPRTRGLLDEERDHAIVILDSAGAVVDSRAAGTIADPAPLPRTTDITSGEGIRTVGSVEDGGPRYRAVALDLPSGGRVVIGRSLADVDATVDEARRILRIVGIAAILASAALCWWFVRRAFAPIDGMIATAGRIADGDLAERTAVADDESEVGRLGAALDTMLDRIEEAVAERTASEERMRRFVADASHDLRTPLTSVRGYAELYRQGADDPAAVAEGMARIEAEATRMSRLVDDLMLLARLDQHRPAGTAPVDLGLVLGEAIDAVRVVDPDRTYDLDAPAGAAVPGDRDQLRQVFDNLLSNARLHTPEGTTVDVRATEVAGNVVVVVADDGPGFDDADREHAFDRFWRSTRADENPVPGSGLGLSIVASITAAHGGTVALDRGPAGGARFTVTLPTVGDGRSTPATSSPVAPDAGQGV